MASFKLNDRLGLDLDVQPGANSGFSRYLADLRTIVIDHDLANVSGLTLGDPLVRSFSTGLNFKLANFQAGAGGGFEIFVPVETNRFLFHPDEYGDNISLELGQRSLSVHLEVSAGVPLRDSLGKVGLGITPGAATILANHRIFDGAPTVVSAIGETIAKFTIPGDVDDLRALDEKTIVTVNRQGTLSFSASAELLSVVNPLATVNLPAPVPALQVKSGESVSVAAQWKISGEYQVRVRKIASDKVRLGYYRKRSSSFSIAVTAGAGISAQLGERDLFSTILGAISSNAKADVAELEGAGVGANQISSIQSAVTAGVQRTLELAVAFELGALNANDAAFLYDIDLAALDDVGRDAIAHALAGDLTAIADNQSLPAGVTMVRSIISNLRARKHTLKVNLLGIYNFISISRLALSGTVVFEPATGELVITDSATAERIRASMVNFGADTQKLRQVMAESFLITAAYRGGNCFVAAPELACRHTYFEVHDTTGRETLRQELDAAVALRLMRDDEQRALVESAQEFGRTAAYAETAYDDQLTHALFLRNGQPRPVEDYEQAGRDAMAALVHEAHRRFPMVDNAIWAKMKDTGQPGFRQLFPQFNEVQVGALTADYTVIRWWADAMHSTAKILAGMSGMDPQTPAFENTRRSLAKHLADVASKTKEEFGRPWGLVAMYLVSDSQAEARVKITGTGVALEKRRAQVISAGV
jgi:hypothetical protein